MNAETAGHAGTATSKLLNTENIEMFRHPKYYKELRKRALDERNKSDQAISLKSSDENNLERAPGQGLKLQAREDSTAYSTRGQVAEPQASSDKPQAPSDSSNKPQASSPKQQASSSKPRSAKSRTTDPS